MMRRFGIALALGLLICGQAQAADCADVKAMSADDLISYLKTNGHSGDPQCVNQAINRLAESRTVSQSAIQVVITLLDFRRPETDPERMHISSTQDWFPAVPALFQMGKSAIGPLIASLGSGRLTDTARQNAIRALLYLNRENPPNAVFLLRKAAANAGTQVESIALESSATEAARSCGKSWKSRCDAALQW